MATASNPVRIDLISDTATRPTPQMRRAMAEAPVGDEQRGEDPSVNALCERVATLLGKEAALFLPSGTMCNQVAIAVHCQPGDEIIAAEASHVIDSEGAGAAVFAGSLIRTIPCSRGIFSGEDVLAAVRTRKPKSPRSRLVEIEQTNNRGGGAVWPLDAIRAVAEAAVACDMALHMDGARLMNAAVAAGVAAADFATPCDTVWLDLSKSLGCPVGGVLAGPSTFIEQAWVWKHRFGGSMRQAGILAAAGLHALDHHVERLAEDHRNARLLAERLSDVGGVRLNPVEVETNLVFFDLDESGPAADEVSARLLGRGIRIGVEHSQRMRAVTHLDVTAEQVEEAADALLEVLRA